MVNSLTNQPNTTPRKVDLTNDLKEHVRSLRRERGVHCTWPAACNLRRASAVLLLPKEHSHFQHRPQTCLFNSLGFFPRVQEKTVSFRPGDDLPGQQIERERVLEKRVLRDGPLCLSHIEAGLLPRLQELSKSVVVGCGIQLGDD